MEIDMELEDKVRRRLAPFVAEGKILAPRFSPAESGLKVSVTLRGGSAHGAVQNALAKAMSDLGAAAQLEILAA